MSSLSCRLSCRLWNRLCRCRSALWAPAWPQSICESLATLRLLRGASKCAVDKYSPRHLSSWPRPQHHSPLPWPSSPPSSSPAASGSWSSWGPPCLPPRPLAARRRGFRKGGLLVYLSTKKTNGAQPADNRFARMDARVRNKKKPNKRVVGDVWTAQHFFSLRNSTMYLFVTRHSAPTRNFGGSSDALLGQARQAVVWRTIVAGAVPKAA